MFALKGELPKLPSLIQEQHQTAGNQQLLDELFAAHYTVEANDLVEGLYFLLLTRANVSSLQRSTRIEQ